jgi:CheY-like chemotaxis protein/nitrogen-specific signal transduction histidine kinase/HPt (histidine-containing phosphotransfer) domain-containing protein
MVIKKILTLINSLRTRKIGDSHDLPHEYEDLYQSKELAELANRAKSEFLANISHEIRTPLNNIQGYIELMERTSLNVKQYKYLHIINKSASDLLGLINDVLDFSKIENMKMEIDSIPFRFLSEIQSVIELFNLKAQKKEIKLLSFIEPDIPPELKGDPLRIKQVLTNLLSNAVKFTHDEGIINIDITRIQEEDTSVELCFSIKDNGIGITENRQQEIFESFVQEGRFISSSYGGTGLGLSICKNLVELMGGDLQIESKKGAGSRFFFNLILEKTARIHENEIDKKYNNSIKTALYIDNKQNILYKKMLLKYLNSMNFNVLEDFDGEMKESVDLIFYLISKSNLDAVPDIFKRESGFKVIALEDDLIVENSDALKKIFDSSIHHPLNAIKILKAISEICPGSPYRFRRPAGEDFAQSPIYHAKVLVADDNADSRNFVKIMLNDLEIDSDTAENGLEAVQKIENNQYDLVFLDMNMPVYSGIEVVEIARENENEKNLQYTPYVALTARAIKGDREMFLSSGFDDYIAKPVNRNKLKEMLDKYLFHLKKIKPEKRKEIEETDTGYENKPGEPYNLNLAAEEMGISTSQLLKLLTAAFVRIDNDLEALKNAIDDKDMENIYEYSHKIKGTFYNFLFNRIGDTAREIEINSDEKKDVDYNGLFNDIIKGLALLKESIKVSSNE